MRRPRSRRDGAIERPSASGCREYAYGGFGGRHPHFQPACRLRECHLMVFKSIRGSRAITAATWLFSTRGWARQARSSRVYPALCPLVANVLSPLLSAWSARPGLCAYPDGYACCSGQLDGMAAQTPPPNPIAARPHVRRVLSRVGGADHAVTPEAPWTGSGWREYSYGGFGGGHPQFLTHAPYLLIRRSGQVVQNRPLRSVDRPDLAVSIGFYLGCRHVYLLSAVTFLHYVD